MPALRHAGLSFALALLPLLALAQSYRCESDGKVTYQSQPCPGGKALPAVPQPNAQDQREASDAAARDRTQAGQMQRERLAREKAARPAGAGVIGPQPVASAPAHHVKKKKRKKGESDYFTAQSPKPPKAPKAPKKPAKPKDAAAARAP